MPRVLQRNMLNGAVLDCIAQSLVEAFHNDGSWKAWKFGTGEVRLSNSNADLSCDLSIVNCGDDGIAIYIDCPGKRAEVIERHLRARRFLPPVPVKGGVG